MRFPVKENRIFLTKKVSEMMRTQKLDKEEKLLEVHIKNGNLLVYHLIKGIIIPTITIKRQIKYKIFQTVCLFLQYFHARIATIQIIIAVAKP